MNYLFQDGGAKPKKAKTSSKTAKSKTASKKVENFLGSNAKKGGMKGGEEKNPLEKYKDALERKNMSLSNNRHNAFRYLASTKSMTGKPASTNEIQ